MGKCGSVGSLNCSKTDNQSQQSSTFITNLTTLHSYYYFFSFPSLFTSDESDEKGLIDFSRHYTGIVIGVACAAIFAILAIMIFSHTRRRLRGNRSDTLTRRQSMPFSDNDVFQQNAPPTYDDGKLSFCTFTPKGRNDRVL